MQHEWDAHLCTFELNGLTQMLFLSAATQYALTTVLAGLAFTITTFPNTSFLPAFVYLGIVVDHPNTGVDQLGSARQYKLCVLTWATPRSNTGRSGALVNATPSSPAGAAVMGVHGKSPLRLHLIRQALMV